MSRLPNIGGDDNDWGSILNDFLSQSHAPDGSLNVNTIGAPQLKTNAVTSVAIAPGAVTSAAIASGSVTSTALGAGAITASAIAEGSLPSAKLSDLGKAGGAAVLDSSGNLTTSTGAIAVTGQTLDAATAAIVSNGTSAVAGALNATIATAIPKATARIPLNIPTYDGNPSVGHPDVLRIPGGWKGYEYWMGFTPHPDAKRENPSVVASHDGVNWVVPASLINPIATYAEVVAEYTATGWWSDTDLVLSPDGTTLMLYYRGSRTEGVADLWLATSTNGTTWTKTKVIAGGVQASPAIVVEADGTYTMFEVLPGVTISRRTSADGITWTAPANGTIPAMTAPHDIWHLDVVKVGGIYHGLVDARAPVGTAPFRLYYWTSTDGLTWTGSSAPAVPITGGRLDRWGHYRSTFQPAASGHPGRFDLWLNPMDDSGTKHDLAVWRFALIRDFDFTDGETWNFPDAAEITLIEESDERVVTAPEIISVLGAAPRGQVPAGTGGFPAIGLRGDTAKDGIAALIPALPDTWSHFTVEALIVNDEVGGGDVTLTSRVTHKAPGSALDAGQFRYVGGTGAATGVPTGAQKVPRWVNIAGYPNDAPTRTVQGALTSIGIERAFGHASDTLAGTVWILALRLRRVRGFGA